MSLWGRTESDTIAATAAAAAEGPDGEEVTEVLNKGNERSSQSGN